MTGVPAGLSTAADRQVRWGVPLAVLVAGMFMSILDVTIVNVAIPTIQNDFGTTVEDVQWIANAYTLALGVVVPLSGWLGDRFGYTRVYVMSVLGFAFGSALCGLAWDLTSLVVFRIVQAIPGGIIPVITLAMVYRIVPKEKIGTAMGMYGLGVVFAPAVGPTLGGYLVEYVDWRLIFFINVPIGVLGAIAAVLALPAFAPGRAGRFDTLGFVAVASGLFALLLALSEGESWGWTSYRVVILLLYGALSLALFVVIELAVAEPLLDVRIFRHWQFTNSLVLIGLMSVALFSGLFYVSLLLQQVQGLGAFEAGLVMLPQALATAVVMPISGRLYDRLGARWPAVVGLFLVALAAYQLSGIVVDTPRQHITWLLVLQGAGMGLAMMPIMTGGLAAVPPHLVSRAGAFNNVVQRTASALGVAVLTAMLTSHQAQTMAGRAALLTDAAAVPDAGPPGVSPLLGLYAWYQRVDLQVYVVALQDVFLVTASISVLAMFGALLLRSTVRAAGGARQEPPAEPVPEVSIPSPRPAPDADIPEGSRGTVAGADAGRR
ncbi:DHA2 family efflux MFS transporter permease subunit [Pseudonocardia zijingensis]|uniref:DHA2 family efflux MFS transporter permease subunit n=1 Tax=Pseudonocardia zijingensis TaxID=153376 RepID=UPI0031D6B0BD